MEVQTLIIACLVRLILHSHPIGIRGLRRAKM